MDDYEEGDDGQFPDHQDYVPYVTYATISQMSGRKVRCWGHLSPTGNPLEVALKTVDDADISLKLSTPYGVLPTSWVEVIGVVQGRTIKCEQMIAFPESTCPDVDKEGHRGLAKLLATLDEPWNLGEGENGHSHME